MNIIDFTDKFQKIEIDNDFFEEKDSEGVFYWDLIRYNIFSVIYYKVANINIAPPSSKTRSKLDLVLIILSNLKGFIKFNRLSGKKYDYICFATSRNKDKDGKRIDIILDDILKYISKKSLIIETFIDDHTTENKYDSSLNYGLVVENYKWSLKSKFKRKPAEHYRISDVLKSEFNVEINLDDEIGKLVKYYKITYPYYLKLFSKIKPKAIFVVQNGIQRGLFAAAKELKIPCIELQHGLIGYVHQAYSYPISIKKGMLNGLPEAFFSFSDFWTKSLNYPVNNIIAMGNNFYASKINDEKKIYDLTFIFANIYTTDFLKLIDNAIEKKYIGEICIKLHPNQFHEMKFISDRYKDNGNVHVIGMQKTMTEVMSLSKSILAIQSTSVYEALHNEVKVFLLKEKNYQTHLDVFDNPNVYLIDTFEEVLVSIDNDFIMSQEYSMFESFNENRFLNFLNDL